MTRKKRKIIITVDGYSSCGKSTFAKAIARELGYIYIDSGAMYRAVTLFALRRGLAGNGIADEAGILNALPEITITFRPDSETGFSATYLNGEKVFVLRFIQGRNPDWVQRPFFAAYDEQATWLNHLRPAFGQETFFFEE